MRFSQRIGQNKIREILQVGSIDVDLKNGLWNTILEDFFDSIYKKTYSQHEIGEASKEVWKQFFKLPVDRVPSDGSRIDVSGVKEFLRNWFFAAEWYEIYDLVEFLSRVGNTTDCGFTEQCNSILKQENSGYRIVNLHVVQITSEVEIGEIEEAFGNSSRLKSVGSHLNAALSLLGDRDSPNYRNSVKESISAVEAFLKIVTENDKGKFSDLLTEVAKKFGIHLALSKAFSSIYGYASDSGGIRHSLKEDDAIVYYEEAKFMLITCSAFINYLSAKVKP